MITKNYIKMCEKAEEIQKGHKFVREDWYFCINSDINITHNIRPCAGIKNQDILQNNTGIFWLPTQEQLQWIISCNWHDVFCEFLWWHSDDNKSSKEFESTFTSMKEVWLAFVMKKKYNKTWTGKDWVINE